MVGRNPYAADPVQWQKLKAARARGAELIVIDPSRTPAAARADLWLRPRPGTDAAIALAMMQVIIAEGLHDQEFVDRWCHGFEALAQRVSEYTPARAAELTGVPAADIESAARRYADGPSVFVSGHGIDAFSAGFQTFRAFHCLLAVCGNLDRAGGNRRAKRPPGLRNWMDLLHDPAFRLAPEVDALRIGASEYPLWSGTGAWQAACHNPGVLNAVLSGEPYPVRAMLVSGVNIVVTYPDPRRTRAALESLEFLAVAAHEMNPTAALADVVLPKTTTLEEEEVQLQPGGPCVSYTAPAHPPLGEARCDLDMANALLDALEGRVAVDRTRLPWRSPRELNTFLLGDSGISLDDLERDGFATFDFETGDFDAQGFATPSGKLELWSRTLDDLGLDPLPDFIQPQGRGDPDWPLLLLTGAREKNFHHSRFRDQDWLRDQTPDPLLEVHPDTAAGHALIDGAWARVETAVGHCRLRVSVSDRVPENLVVTGMGWWRPREEGPEYGALDVNVNAALAYSGPLDPVTGSPDSRVEAGFAEHSLPGNAREIRLYRSPFRGRCPLLQAGFVDRFVCGAETIERIMIHRRRAAARGSLHNHLAAGAHGLDQLAGILVVVHPGGAALGAQGELQVIDDHRDLAAGLVGVTRVQADPSPLPGSGAVGDEDEGVASFVVLSFALYRLAEGHAGQTAAGTETHGAPVAKAAQGLVCRDGSQGDDDGQKGRNDEANGH
jgi:anaerobic selenocysteine-containing dehydrogenase